MNDIGKILGNFKIAMNYDVVYASGEEFKKAKEELTNLIEKEREDAVIQHVINIEMGVDLMAENMKEQIETGKSKSKGFIWHEEHERIVESKEREAVEDFAVWASADPDTHIVKLGEKYLSNLAEQEKE